LPPRSGSLAAEILGMLQMFGLNNAAGAEESWRRAIKLDPGRESARYLLVAMLATNLRFAEAKSVSQEGVALRDCAATRYAHAKVLCGMLLFDQAEEQVRLALKHEPDNPTPTLGLAALMLRRGNLDLANEHLDRAAKLLEREDRENRRL